MPRPMSLRGDSQYVALVRRTSSNAATLKRASRMAPIARWRSRRLSFAMGSGFIGPPYASGGAVPPAGEINKGAGGGLARGAYGAPMSLIRRIAIFFFAASLSGGVLAQYKVAVDDETIFVAV